MLGYMVTNELRSKYVHKGTGDVTYEKPADYRSDGSYYFFDSESDEYPDVYTNVSTIRQNDDTANNFQEFPSPTNHLLDHRDAFVETSFSEEQAIIRYYKIHSHLLIFLVKPCFKCGRTLQDTEIQMATHRQ